MLRVFERVHGLDLLEQAGVSHAERWAGGVEGRARLLQRVALRPNKPRISRSGIEKARHA